MLNPQSISHTHIARRLQRLLAAKDRTKIPIAPVDNGVIASSISFGTTSAEAIKKNAAAAAAITQKSAKQISLMSPNTADTH